MEIMICMVKRLTSKISVSWPVEQQFRVEKTKPVMVVVKLNLLSVCEYLGRSDFWIIERKEGN